MLLRVLASLHLTALYTIRPQIGRVGGVQVAAVLEDGIHSLLMHGAVTI